MDPILIGAGLLALYKGKRVAQKVGKRNAKIENKIERLEILKKDLGKMKELLDKRQITPDNLASYLSHIEKDLPVKAKRKFSLNPFKKEVENPLMWFKSNLNRVENMIEAKSGKTKSPFFEGLKEGIVWGVGAYGLGQIAKRVINSSNKTNSYQVYYTDNRSMY